MKRTSEVRSAGLVAVRIAWITAIVVCALAILIGLVTGTGDGNSSQQFPGFAFSAGRDSSHHSTGSTLLHPAAAMSGAAVPVDPSGWGKKGDPGDTHSGPGVPPRSGSQPEYTGGRSPVVTRRPKLPQAPGGDPAEAPQTPSVETPKPPKPPQAPEGDPVEAPQAPEGDPVDAPQAPSVTLSKPPKPPKPPKP